jgi:hypothetical protein
MVSRRFSSLRRRAAERNNLPREKQYLSLRGSEYICESGPCGVSLCIRGGKWHNEYNG